MCVCVLCVSGVISHLPEEEEEEDLICLKKIVMMINDDVGVGGVLGTMEMGIE